MMVAGLLRLVATSGVFLLSATVFTSSVPRAGASSTVPAAESNDDTTTDLCPAELLACDEDNTCFACISVTETSSTEFWECEAAAASSSASSSSSATDEACAEGWQAMCCINEASEFDCMANGVYLDYVTCLLAETGCSIEDVSCPSEGESNNAGDMTLDASHGGAGAGAGAGAASSGGTISGTSIAFTLAFAFVFFTAGVSVGVVMSMKFMPGSHPFTRIK